MQAERIRYLRKIQFIYTNVLYVLYLILFSILLIIGIQMTHFYLGAAVLMLISIIVQLKPPSFIPVINELKEYEKNRLGPEYDKLRRTNFISQLVLVLIFLAQAFLLKPLGEL